MHGGCDNLSGVQITNLFSKLINPGYLKQGPGDEARGTGDSALSIVHFSYFTFDIAQITGF